MTTYDDEVSSTITRFSPVSTIRKEGPTSVTVVEEIDTGLPVGHIEMGTTFTIPVISTLFQRVESESNVSTTLLTSMVVFVVAVLALIATQALLKNILLSTIAGGVVLILITLPAVGLGGMWAVGVYFFVCLPVVVIGQRMQL